MTKFASGYLFAIIVLLCGARPALNAEIREFTTGETESIGYALFDQYMALKTARKVLSDWPQWPASIPAESVTLWDFETSGDEIAVVFVPVRDGKGGRPVRVYTEDRKTWSLQTWPAGSPFTPSTSLRAKALVMGNFEPMCDAGYDFFTTADPDGQGYLVHALVRQKSPTDVPIGGNVRHSVDALAEKIERTDALSSSCLLLSTQPNDDGGSLAALVTSHHVSQKSVEVHVYLNLVHRIPLYVGTMEKRVWQVSRGKLKDVTDEE